MRYFKKLVGEKVYVSPVNSDDYEIYTKWLNDENVTKYLTIHNSYVTIAGEKDFLNSINSSDFIFAIVKNDNTLIGNIGLHNLDYKNGTATLGIFIGDEENMSKGYGSEAIKLLINFAFNELRLHNIMLNVFDFNARAIKAYTKCGFTEFGRRHDAFFRNGKYHDEVYMEIVKKVD